MRIIILNEGKGMPCLYIEGISSKSYPFKWDKEAGEYTYETNRQEEVDDIFQSQTLTDLFYFSAKIPAAGEAGAQKAPTVPRHYYSDLEQHELLTLAKDCGLPAKPKMEAKMLIALLDAYYLGAGQREEKPKATGSRKKEEPESD